MYTDAVLILEVLRNGLEMPKEEALKIAADKYVNVDIHKPENKAKLEMLEELQDALRKEDPVKAMAVVPKDELLDRINRASAGILADYAREHADAIPLCLGLGAVIRKLERTGDHLTNIAEEIVFYIDAKVLKHKNPQDK